MWGRRGVNIIPGLLPRRILFCTCSIAACHQNTSIIWKDCPKPKMKVWCYVMQPFPPLPFLLFLDPPWSCQRFHLFASNSNSERKRENKVRWQRVKCNLTGGQDSPDREKGHSQWDQHRNSFKGNTGETSKWWGELAHMGFSTCVHTTLKLKWSQLASKGLNKALTELAGIEISKTKLPGWQGAKSSHYSTRW